MRTFTQQKRGGRSSGRTHYGPPITATLPIRPSPKQGPGSHRGRRGGGASTGAPRALRRPDQSGASARLMDGGRLRTAHPTAAATDAAERSRRTRAASSAAATATTTSNTAATTAAT
jgi:hypothetical protein